MKQSSLHASALLIALAFSGIAHADDSSAAIERLKRVATATSLEDITTRPWHAKLGVTLFDADGKNPVEATIDYWQSGKDSRRMIVVGADTDTKLRSEGKTYSGTTGLGVTSTAKDVFDTFIQPAPTLLEIDQSKPESRRQNFGKTPLDCVILSHRLAHISQIPFGLYPTFCLDTTADRLLARSTGNIQMSVNRVGRFLDHDVSMAFTLTEGKAELATAKVLDLTTFIPALDSFTPGPELKPAVEHIVKISSGVIAGLKKSGQAPTYPDSGRRSHTEGTVILHAIIGRDGHVHRLQVVSTPDADLAISALAAVRLWVYKPYILSGEPTDVDTTVVVNFNLR